MKEAENNKLSKAKRAVVLYTKKLIGNDKNKLTQLNRFLANTIEGSQYYVCSNIEIEELDLTKLKSKIKSLRLDPQDLGNLRTFVSSLEAAMKNSKGYLLVITNWLNSLVDQLDIENFNTEPTIKTSDEAKSKSDVNDNGGSCNIQPIVDDPMIVTGMASDTSLSVNSAKPEVALSNSNSPKSSILPTIQKLYNINLLRVSMLAGVVAVGFKVTHHYVPLLSNNEISNPILTRINDNLPRLAGEFIALTLSHTFMTINKNKDKDPSSNSKRLVMDNLIPKLVIIGLMTIIELALIAVGKKFSTQSPMITPSI